MSKIKGIALPDANIDYMNVVSLINISRFYLHDSARLGPFSIDATMLIEHGMEVEELNVALVQRQMDNRLSLTCAVSDLNLSRNIGVPDSQHLKSHITSKENLPLSIPHPWTPVAWIQMLTREFWKTRDLPASLPPIAWTSEDLIMWARLAQIPQEDMDLILDCSAAPSLLWNLAYTSYDGEFWHPLPLFHAWIRECRQWHQMRREERMRLGAEEARRIRKSRHLASINSSLSPLMQAPMSDPTEELMNIEPLLSPTFPYDSKENQENSYPRPPSAPLASGSGNSSQNIGFYADDPRISPEEVIVPQETKRPRSEFPLSSLMPTSAFESTTSAKPDIKNITWNDFPLTFAMADFPTPCAEFPSSICLSPPANPTAPFGDPSVQKSLIEDTEHLPAQRNHDLGRMRDDTEQENPNFDEGSLDTSKTPISDISPDYDSQSSYSSDREFVSCSDKEEKADGFLPPLDPAISPDSPPYERSKRRSRSDISPRTYSTTTTLDRDSPELETLQTNPKRSRLLSMSDGNFSPPLATSKSAATPGVIFIGTRTDPIDVPETASNLRRGLALTNALKSKAGKQSASPPPLNIEKEKDSLTYADDTPLEETTILELPNSSPSVASGRYLLWRSPSTRDYRNIAKSNRNERFKSFGRNEKKRKNKPAGSSPLNHAFEMEEMEMIYSTAYEGEEDSESEEEEEEKLGSGSEESYEAHDEGDNHEALLPVTTFAESFAQKRGNGGTSRPTQGAKGAWSSTDEHCPIEFPSSLIYHR